MKKYIVLLLIFMLSVTSAHSARFNKDYFYNVDVISVYDGDTFKVETEVWPSIKVNTNIRLYGIDTPEKTWRAKCEKEKVLAIEARNYLVNVTEIAKSNNIPITITGIKNDKYAGRHIAKLMIGNVDVSKNLIEEGYAVEYFGKGAKKDWCI